MSGMANANGDLQVQIRESQADNDKPYTYAFSYEKATLYEYKFERQPDPDEIDPCYRCNKRVLFPDQVNLGVLYHKDCFRCRICGLPLTIQTFHRNQGAGVTDREVYCRNHVGKTQAEIEQERLAPALNSDHSPVSPTTRKYVIQIEGKIMTPGQSPPQQPQIQQYTRRSPRNQSPINHSPRNQSPNTTMAYGSPGNLTNGSMNSTLTNVTNMSTWPGYTPPQTWGYGTVASRGGRALPRPIPVLKSYHDFENAGVFEAQNILESRHREEEERLQRYLTEEREKELSRVDDNIEVEKERAAAELLASIGQISLQDTSKRNLVAERSRLEDHFHRQHEHQLRNVMDKIANEEKTRLSKMTERHGNEMMILISEKDREVDNNALFDHSMKPPIIPPETKKAELYKCPTIFERIDKRAVELANRDYYSFTDLVRDLTRDCTNELEKARALFRWVIAKDLGRHNVNEIVRPYSSASLLKGVRSGKETYHQLFKKLCSFAGLHCEIILGYSKGAGYKPGMRIEGSTFRNSWTAVAIDGSWRYVNCTWAARHVTGHKDDLPQVFHKYDEFYFLTDPEDYVYQHYPDDPQWQLLEIPLPFSEFINLPVVKSPFFNYGLKFYSNYGATLNTDNGLVEIRLLAPKILGFGSMLEAIDKNAEQTSLEGRTLLRLVKNEAIFTVSLPKPGLYYFSIFSGDYWQSDCLESACSFLINCTRMPGPTAPPYPPVPYYGPTPIMEKLGISTITHIDPLIVMSGDNLEMQFRMDKDVKITHTFQYFDITDASITDIDRYVFLRSRSEESATFAMRCSREGYYIFSLFGANGQDAAASLDCVYRYLIVCQQANTGVQVFPKTYHKWQRCTLHEPLAGDLLLNKRYNFRMDVPQAVELFLVIGETWHHMRRKIGFTWEGSVHTGSKPSLAKVYARFSISRDSSMFSHLLDFEIVEDGETEI